MTLITRFAPSPTGFLHIGNARTAVLCALLAAHENGQFILRIDDTDTERSEERYVTALHEDLARLSITPDRIERQSERRDRYKECIEKLKESGRLYDCYESPEDIEMKRKIALGRGLPPIYDREALHLTDAQKSELKAQGRKPHWRFRLDDHTHIQWNDRIRGQISFDPKHLSDPVLIRENGDPTYMLPSAIDDIDFGVTLVLRGEDHISNTAIQIQLFDALGSAAPEFAHLSLMKTSEGKMSKRKGGFEIRHLLDSGIESMALVSYLARIGSSRPTDAIYTMQAAADEFNFSVFSRSPAIFTQKELERINAKIVRHYSYDDISARPECQGIDATFWDAVKHNLHSVSDIQEWRAICLEEPQPIIDEPEYLSLALTCLPGGTWDHTTWSTWTAAVKEKTGRKGKALFMPLRKALTGRDNGPELDGLLPHIGAERARKRLSHTSV